MTSAQTRLLDRDIASVDIAEDHSETLNLLDEVVDYGSDLILRCFESSEKDLVAAMVIGVLLRHGVSMLDAVAVLSRAGTVTAAWPSLRAMVDSQMFASLILRENSVRRAGHFYVWNLRRQRRWMRRIQEGTPEFDAFRHVWDSWRISSTDQEIARAKEEVERISRQLAHPDFLEIDRAFEETAKPSHDGWWFSPLGFRSIRGVAEEVEMLEIYDMFYSIASEVAHGTNFQTSVSFDGSEMSIKSLRDSEGFSVLTGLALSLSFAFFRLMLGRFRSGEEANFARKYVDDWQSRFLRNASR